jgi:hypothetical protein
MKAYGLDDSYQFIIYLQMYAILQQTHIWSRRIKPIIYVVYSQQIVHMM